MKHDAYVIMLLMFRIAAIPMFTAVRSGTETPPLICQRLTSKQENTATLSACNDCVGGIRLFVDAVTVNRSLTGWRLFDIRGLTFYFHLTDSGTDVLSMFGESLVSLSVKTTSPGIS